MSALTDRYGLRPLATAGTGAAPAPAEGADLDAQLESATVRETHFFRDPNQLELVHAHAAGKVLAGRQPVLRGLSAGCATGEEAYSLAATLKSAAYATPGGAEPPAIEVWGVDVVRSAIAHAERGVYGGWSMRAPPPAWAGRMVTRQGDCWVVADALRATTRFATGNLVDPEWSPPGTPPYDVILCRNVLMYFEPETAAQVVTRLYALLADDGLLLLSPVDAGLCPPGARVHPNDAATFLRPSAPAVRAPVSRPRGSRGNDAEASGPYTSTRRDQGSADASLRRDEHGAPAGPGASARGVGRWSSATGGADRSPSGTHRIHPDGSPPARVGGGARATGAAAFQREVLLREAARAANRGDVHGTRAVCDVLLEADGRDADALYLLALAEVNEGDVARACRHLRSALESDRAFAMARYALACALRSAGDVEAANTEWAALRELLSSLSPDALLRGPEEISAAWLMGIVPGPGEVST